MEKNSAERRNLMQYTLEFNCLHKMSAKRLGNLSN